MLRAGEVDAFNQAARERGVVDFRGADLRSIDFRRVDLSNVILRDTYLRDADFRGCDLRHLDLTGASLHNARVSGVYFPYSLPASEIRMSLRHGTRLRYRSPD
jgi:uncharacterized protein YjbI with pentapeptide repeats